ncbi:hypothetical protein QIS99_28080 [Streptomyces sp. B-S-A8]|uniref:Uncharacterized protein n=1 Tax=Streptomyces solicavernae TaxID=3043614 RepID=A0ABT6S018_9ACTN|nr:hypothetical protein [Streptomyces sp. B-S-A8]MDI3390021.1 hypothetical protein [Streptomyces sp. B-S-A8]
MVREFERLLKLLHEQGLTWLTVDDVINNLGPVAAWSMTRGQLVERWYTNTLEAGSGPLSPRLEPPSERDARIDLQDLCVEADWPLPLKGGGRDYTTPAALAVSRAKERLAEAMLTDSTEQGVSANVIADRARNAQSRPTTLKMLAAELLQHDASQALRPLLEADVPLYVSRGLDRTVMLGSMWEDEPEEERLRHLTDAGRALSASRLQLHDTQTGEVADIRQLAADDAGRLEVRRGT